MSAKVLLVLVALFKFSSAQQLVNNYICTEDFCEKYAETTGCDALEESCLVQNSTMSGIILPSQTPCSCCEACLQHLNEGDDCTLGLIGAPVPSTVCGPDLTCTRGSEEEHATCQYRTATTCLGNVEQFNEGLITGNLGHLMDKPDCNNLGDFNAFRCIPGQICYCVDKYGQRIFGEALYAGGMAILMRCECAREEAKLRQMLHLESSNKFIRCNAWGAYERLQCLGDQCICVDHHMGSPASPVYNRTDLSDLQEDWKCFDGSEEILRRPCEERRQELLAKNLPNHLASHDDLATMCQPDGWYDRVQRNETHEYCVDKYGIPIDGYGQLLFEEGIDTNATRINCNCARVVDLLRSNNRIEFPQCCPNGNYKRINCRRGYCYCVDTNGQQTTAEVPRQNQSLLTCSVDDEFPHEDAQSECN